MWLMQLYPSVTNIHINIVDVLIAIVYSSDQQVLVALSRFSPFLLDSFLQQHRDSQTGLRDGFKCGGDWVL